MPTPYGGGGIITVTLPRVGLELQLGGGLGHCHTPHGRVIIEHLFNSNNFAISADLAGAGMHSTEFYFSCIYDDSMMSNMLL